MKKNVYKKNKKYILLGIVIIIVIGILLGYKIIKTKNSNSCCTCLDCPMCEVCCDCDDPYMSK